MFSRPVPFSRLLRHCALVAWLACAAVVIPGSAKADYDSGLAAFEAGDYAVARDEWLPLAEAGDPRAQHGIGLLYETGRGVVERSDKEAVKWYRAASVQGLPAALSNLALMYAEGRGVARDLKQAATLWEQAALAGQPMAQFNLGLLYYRGNGVNKDDRLAARWFAEAATQGVSDAQFAIAEMYRLGRGVNRDLTEARRWYAMAAEGGNLAALRLLGALGGPPPDLEASLPPIPPEKPALTAAVPAPQAIGRGEGSSITVEEPAAPPPEASTEPSVEPTPSPPAAEAVATETAAAEAAAAQAPMAPDSLTGPGAEAAASAVPPATAEGAEPAPPPPVQPPEGRETEAPAQLAAIPAPASMDAAVSQDTAPTSEAMAIDPPAAPSQTTEPPAMEAPSAGEAELLTAPEETPVVPPVAEQAASEGAGAAYSGAAATAEPHAEAAPEELVPDARVAAAEAVLAEAPPEDAPVEVPLFPTPPEPMPEPAPQQDIQGDEPAAAAAPDTAPHAEAAPADEPGETAGPAADAPYASDMAPMSRQPDPAPADPAPAGKVYRVWLSEIAGDRSAAAEADWSRLLRSYPDLLGQRQPQLRRVDLGEGIVRYRVLAGPFDGRAEAQTLCDSIQARDPDEHCMVVVN